MKIIHRLSVSTVAALLLAVAPPVAAQEIPKKTIDDILAHVDVIKDKAAKPDDRTKSEKALERHATRFLDELLHDPEMPDDAVSARLGLLRDLGPFAVQPMESFVKQAEERAKELIQQVAVIKLARLDRIKAEVVILLKKASPAARQQEDLEILRGTYKVTKEKEGLSSRNTIAAASMLSEAAMKAGEYKDVRDCCSEVLPAIRELKDEDSRLWTLDMVARLALAHANLRSLDAARPLIQEAESLLKNVHLPQSARLIEVHWTLANACTWLSDDRKVLGHLEKATAFARQTFGEKNGVTLDMVREQGNVLRRLGEFKLGEERYQQYLVVMRKEFPGFLVEIAKGEQGLAVCMRKNGKLKQALPLAQSAVDKFKSKKGANDRDTASAMATLGLIQTDLKDFDAAKKSLEQSLAVRQKLLPADHPEVKLSREYLEQLDAAKKK